MAKIELSIGELLRHPATIAGTLTAVLGGVLQWPVVVAAWSSFYASAGSLFGALAVLSFLADHIPALQSSWVVVPMVFVGAIVLHRRATDWWQKFNEKLNS